ncbi:hypothetical protein HY797_00280 [Candidatus Falkowbacteria bacterium]|nr:hypothetical protein [Candidatus Falkowbacteria bacterium]
MTTKVQLSAQARSESNGKAKKIRTAGFIPAVLYGFGKANQNIKVKKHDFEKVDMTKKITTEIPLNFVGEAKAVKELGGTLVKNMDTVEVECLPGDLVSHIDVDISILENFDQFIRLHDLILPQGIVLAQETNEAVVGVAETKIEEEAPKAEAVPAEGQEAGEEENKADSEAKDASEKK